ncbi:hypothetical protein B484DRAFT_420778 [Ochromonadaceae sp. CCMP2298]|nr:hypothetical protein B484DRAFT_420778 [Ochromonadaceae sp. CCMP2298]
MSSTVDMGDMGGEGGEGGEGGVRDLGGAGAQDTDVGFDEMEREMEREGEGAGAEVVVAVKVEAEVVAVEVELGDGAGLLSALMSRRDTAPLPSSPDPASLSPLDSKTRKKRRKKVSPSKSKGSPKKTDVRRFDHPQRCWDISLDDPIKPVRWYFLGAYDRYDLAVRGRGAVVRMAVGDSGGTIILDPRVTVSDEEIAAEAGLKGTDGMGVTGTLGTGDMGGTGGMGGMGKGPGGQGELRGSNTLRRLNSLDAIGGGAVAEKPDTAEMILGRVRRKKDKTSKVRIRRDLTRMQWVLETDDKSVHKIASRHRKKTGVDMEGAADDGVAGQAKSALRKQAQAQVEEVDLVTRTLRSLPPMDQAIYQDITQVLGHSKSFGSFALASELIAFQRRLEQARGSSKNKGKGKKRGLVVAAGFVGKYDPTRKEATVIKTPVFSTEEGGPEKRISGGFSLFHSPRFGGTGPIGTSANILPDIHTRGGTS